MLPHTTKNHSELVENKNHTVSNPHEMVLNNKQKGMGLLLLEMSVSWWQDDSMIIPVHMAFWPLLTKVPPVY